MDTCVDLTRLRLRRPRGDRTAVRPGAPEAARTPRRGDAGDGEDAPNRKRVGAFWVARVGSWRGDKRREREEEEDIDISRKL